MYKNIIEYTKGYEDGKNDILDKIKTEIERAMSVRYLGNFDSVDLDFWCSLMCVRNIIDKYKVKSKSQESEGQMQIVIDMPEEEYKNYLKMRPAYPEGVFCYIKAIQHGTPLDKMLDKIRAEIELNTYPSITIYRILGIIDKYKAESEE